MTVTEINNNLQREILDGKGFDILMPFSDCSSVVLGSGDTSFGINEIQKWAYKYQHHTKEISQKFRKNNLKETCQHVHYFAYNYFQYKIDGANQLLRSPACAWKQRYEGVDCKSYSIIVSTILLNLGIPHYLRRIKQNNDFPNAYTHIYVVVPKDGTNLDNGYYTIDGTISNFSELPRLEYDDVFMDLVSNVGLSTPSFEDSIDDFSNQSIDQVTAYIEQYSGVLKQQTAQVIGAVGDAASSIASELGPVGKVVGTVVKIATAVTQLAVMLGYDPCASSYYKADDIGHRLKYEFLPKFKKTAGDLQSAIQDGTMVGLVRSLNELLKEIDLAKVHYEVERETNDDNKCGQETLNSYSNYVSQIHKVVSSLYSTLVITLKSNFNVEEITITGYTNERSWYFIVPIGERLITANYRKIKVYKKNENLKKLYPYGSDIKFREWARTNKVYLNLTYGDNRGNRYYDEIKSFGSEIAEIRRKIYVSAIYRKDMEDVLREKMSKIYLKYDIAAAQKLQTDFQTEVAKINKNLVDFNSELEMIKSQKRIAEINRQNNSKIISGAKASKFRDVVLGLGGMYLISDLIKNNKIKI